MAQPANDSPCNAHYLIARTSCQFEQFTNMGADDSGLPLTECAAYSGGDVWFKVKVPISGNLTIELYSEATQQFPNNNGWMYRPGLAVYTGSCTALIHDTCWIDPGPESPPLKPLMILEGKQPGDTLFLRVWEYANNDNGIFEICVHDPDAGIPSDLLIPQGFSPNDDGLNDTFEILGIEYYPDNELFVYNIWANEVYHMSGYDNGWDGTASTKISLGQKLPSGTYFYILNLGNGQSVKGFVYLKRE